MRVNSAARSGQIVFSIDVSNGNDATAASTAARDEVCRRLVELFVRYQFPATWFAAEPASWTGRSVLPYSGPSHEIALLGSADWANPGVARGQFAAELDRRLLAARAAGVSVTTLALSGGALSEHHDLLVKQGISMIRPASIGLRQRGWMPQPSALRHGLWQTPVCVQIPSPQTWLPLSLVLFWIRRAMRQAAESSAVLHLSIDAARLAVGQERGFKMLERAFHLARHWQLKGQLSAGTLAQLALRLGRRRRSSPARSILRKAA